MNQDLRERLQLRFAGRPRNVVLVPRPRPTTPPASTEFSPLTDETLEQQEQERIKHNLPF